MSFFLNLDSSLRVPAGTIADSGETRIIAAATAPGLAGSVPYTVGGTVAAGTYSYQLYQTRIRDNHMVGQTAVFVYYPGATPGVNDFAAKFAMHLNLYHDLQVTAAAAVITVKSAFRGYNPTITLLNGTVTLTAGSVTAAVAGGAFIPGDVVSVGKVGSEWQVQMFNPTAGDRLPIGILVNDNGYPYHTHKDMADNRVWNVMLTGTIWVTQGGSTPVDADDFAIGISGTRMPTTLLPLTGKFLGASGWDVTGTLPILGKWDRGTGASVDGLNKFSTQDVGVLPGQTFRVTLK